MEDLCSKSGVKNKKSSSKRKEKEDATIWKIKKETEIKSLMVNSNKIKSVKFD